MWFVVNHALNNALWALEGGVVDHCDVTGDGEWQRVVQIVQGSIGVLEEVYVCREHDWTVCMVGLGNYEGWCCRQAGLAVRDQGIVEASFFLDYCVL